MDITFLLPRFDLTGGNRVVAIYAEGLRNRGHRVVAVAPAEPRPPLRRILKSIATGNGLPRREEATHFDETGVESRILDHRGPIVDADLPDADVVVATWWETAEWTAALSPQKGAKVHFMQDYEVWGGPKARVDATCRLPMPKIVIAQWTYDLLRDRFHQTPLALIPNGVDTERFRAEPRGKQQTPTVGLAYTPFRNKGTDISLEAVALAREQLPELRLVAFGRIRPTRSLPLPSGTDYFLRAPDPTLKDIYARCDAWLFGTRIEGFGLPILEAMACRTPVIGTPAGAAPEILARGGGALVPHEDPTAMAREILRVCRMPDDEWQALSDQAASIARATTWDDAIDRFEEALETVGNGG